MSTNTNNDCDLSNVVLHVNNDGEEQVRRTFITSKNKYVDKKR